MWEIDTWEGMGDKVYVEGVLTSYISTASTADIVNVTLEADFSAQDLSANIEENILSADLTNQNEATL